MAEDKDSSDSLLQINSYPTIKYYWGYECLGRRKKWWSAFVIIINVGVSSNLTVSLFIRIDSWGFLCWEIRNSIGGMNWQRGLLQTFNFKISTYKVSDGLGGRPGHF